MSKKFKTQDHFRYKRLGKRWRKPKGRQSKLRKRKGGSGLMVSIGYRTPKKIRGKIQGVNARLAWGANDLMETDEAILIASGVGAKKTAEIAERAKKLNVRILNMKKVRRSAKIARLIEKKKLERKTKIEKEKKKEEKKETEKVEQGEGKETEAKKTEVSEKQ